MAAQEPKYCPLLKETCKKDACVFWTTSEETVMKNCAIVVIAQQLDIMAVKGASRRLG